MTYPSSSTARAAPAEPVPQHFHNSVSRYFAATRPPFLAITLVACLIGLASAYAGLGGLNIPYAIATVLFALLAQAGANVINDYHDAESGTDDVNVRRIFPFTGGSRFIQNKVLTPRQTATLGYTLLAITITGGLWLVWQTGYGLLIIGLVGIGLGWAYSAPPLRLVSRGVGEIAIVCCWLLIVVGADYVQRGHFAWMPFLAGFSYALLVTDVLYVNQFPDHDSDAATGKRTLIVRLGPESAKWGYFGIATLAYGWLFLQIGRDNLPPGCAAAAFPLALSLNAARLLREHASEPENLAPAIRLTIAAVLLHGLILALTLALNWRGG